MPMSYYEPACNCDHVIVVPSAPLPYRPTHVYHDYRFYPHHYCVEYDFYRPWEHRCHHVTMYAPSSWPRKFNDNYHHPYCMDDEPHHHHHCHPEPCHCVDQRKHFDERFLPCCE